PQLRLRFRGPEPGQIDGHPSRIQNGARAFVAGGLFLMLVLGRGFAFSVWRLGLAGCGRLMTGRQHSTAQNKRARTMAGFFEFGCGDRI
ncbi:hypothetical protein, partial [Mesorhizobium sp. WSM1293]|uniref:hypothetical protein n=1 Tax=Mesorhizobium sp. WSM1293 TaxID=1040984 RepID=UPI001AEC70EC